MAWNYHGRTAWSAAEDAKLRALLAEGKSPCACAKELGRSQSSVYRRVEIINATPKAGKRPCMCCKRLFASAGHHNRLCSRCRQIDTTPFHY